MNNQGESFKEAPDILIPVINIYPPTKEIEKEPKKKKYSKQNLPPMSSKTHPVHGKNTKQKVTVEDTVTKPARKFITTKKYSEAVDILVSLLPGNENNFENSVEIYHLLLKCYNYLNEVEKQVVSSFDFFLKFSGNVLLKMLPPEFFDFVKWVKNQRRSILSSIFPPHPTFSEEKQNLINRMFESGQKKCEVFVKQFSKYSRQPIDFARNLIKKRKSKEKANPERMRTVGRLFGCLYRSLKGMSGKFPIVRSIIEIACVELILNNGLLKTGEMDEEGVSGMMLVRFASNTFPHFFEWAGCSKSVQVLAKSSIRISSCKAISCEKYYYFYQLLPLLKDKKFSNIFPMTQEGFRLAFSDPANPNYTYARTHGISFYLWKYLTTGKSWKFFDDQVEVLKSEDKLFNETISMLSRIDECLRGKGRIFRWKYDFINPELNEEIPYYGRFLLRFVEAIYLFIVDGNVVNAGEALADAGRWKSDYSLLEEIHFRLFQGVIAGRCLEDLRIGDPRFASEVKVEKDRLKESLSYFEKLEKFSTSFFRPFLLYLQAESRRWNGSSSEGKERKGFVGEVSKMYFEAATSAQESGHLLMVSIIMERRLRFVWNDGYSIQEYEGCLRNTIKAWNDLNATLVKKRIIRKFGQASSRMLQRISDEEEKENKKSQQEEDDDDDVEEEELKLEFRPVVETNVNLQKKEKEKEKEDDEEPVTPPINIEDKKRAASVVGQIFDLLKSPVSPVDEEDLKKPVYKVSSYTDGREDEEKKKKKREPLKIDTTSRTLLFKEKKSIDIPPPPSPPLSFLNEHKKVKVEEIEELEEVIEQGSDIVLGGEKQQTKSSQEKKKKPNNNNNHDDDDDKEEEVEKKKEEESLPQKKQATKSIASLSQTSKPKNSPTTASLSLSSPPPSTTYPPETNEEKKGWLTKLFKKKSKKKGETTNHQKLKFESELQTTLLQSCFSRYEFLSEQLGLLGYLFPKSMVGQILEERKRSVLRLQSKQIQKKGMVKSEKIPLPYFRIRKIGKFLIQDRVIHDVGGGNGVSLFDEEDDDDILALNSSIVFSGGDDPELQRKKREKMKTMIRIRKQKKMKRMMSYRSHELYEIYYPKMYREEVLTIYERMYRLFLKKRFGRVMKIYMEHFAMNDHVHPRDRPLSSHHNDNTHKTTLNEGSSVIQKTMFYLGKAKRGLSQWNENVDRKTKLTWRGEMLCRYLYVVSKLYNQCQLPAVWKGEIPVGWDGRPKMYGQARPPPIIRSERNGKGGIGGSSNRNPGEEVIEIKEKKNSNKSRRLKLVGDDDDDDDVEDFFKSLEDKEEENKKFNFLDSVGDSESVKDVRMYNRLNKAVSKKRNAPVELSPALSEVKRKLLEEQKQRKLEKEDNDSDFDDDDDDDEDNKKVGEKVKKSIEPIISGVGKLTTWFQKKKKKKMMIEPPNIIDPLSGPKEEEEEGKKSVFRKWFGSSKENKKKKKKKKKKKPMEEQRPQQPNNDIMSLNLRKKKKKKISQLEMRRRTYEDPSPNLNLNLKGKTNKVVPKSAVGAVGVSRRNNSFLSRLRKGREKKKKKETVAEKPKSSFKAFLEERDRKRKKNTKSPKVRNIFDLVEKKDVK